MRFDRLSIDMLGYNANVRADAHSVIARNQRPDLSMYIRSSSGYVFIVDEPPNRHCFLSRLVNWMINRAGKKRMEVSGEIRSRRAGGASLNSSCAI